MAGRELPKILTADEVDAFFRIPNRSAPTGIRNLAMLTVMHRCGLRVSEACGLHLRDVERRESRIHIRGVIAKGGREAYVPYDDHTEQLLERWVDVRRGFAARRPHLFTTLQGGPVSRHYCYQMVRRYARRAGIERKVGPHTLRHTFAVELMRDGFNLREVQELLRHADIRTTVIYTHISQQELARKVRDRRR